MQYLCKMGAAAFPGFARSFVQGMASLAILEHDALVATVHLQNILSCAVAEAAVHASVSGTQRGLCDVIDSLCMFQSCVYVGESD